MIVSTHNALKDYRKALIKWLYNRGLEGKGGAFDRPSGQHTVAAEPKPEDFGIEGFALKIAAKIKDDETQKWIKENK